MNAFHRWGKFVLVGALGAVVQLAALALFDRWTAGHPLCASAAAVELALVHNFIWHVHYTWRGRQDGNARVIHQFVRFQMSNGLVSLAGNVILMRLFIRYTHAPLLVLNIAAMVCCSVANFCLANNWVFTELTRAHYRRYASFVSPTE